MNERLYLLRLTTNFSKKHMLHIKHLTLPNGTSCLACSEGCQSLSDIHDNLFQWLYYDKSTADIILSYTYKED